MRRSLGLVCLLALVEVPLFAQDSLPASPSHNLGSLPASLAGLRSVKLYVFPEGAALPDGTVESAQSYVALELRKAGVRIDAEGAPQDSTAGMLGVVITRVARSLTTDWRVRFELLQQGRLDRIPGTIWINTWSHREETLNGVPQSVEAMIHHSTDVFLGDWLTAQGR